MKQVWVGRFVAAVLLVCGLVLSPAHAQEVYACVDGSVVDGAIAQTAGQACGTEIQALPAALGSSAYVGVCRGGTLVAGGSLVDCLGDGGAVVWAQVGAFHSDDLVINSDFSVSAPASFTFGVGGSGASPPFDVSTLDKATLTAYFSTGWFIVALGWITGKGVSLLVQFVKHI